MKVKIVSGGAGRNTCVQNAETGETIENVYAVEWTCFVDGMATAKLFLRNVPVELVAEEITTKVTEERAYNG